MQYFHLSLDEVLSQIHCRQCQNEQNADFTKPESPTADQIFKTNKGSSMALVLHS